MPTVPDTFAPAVSQGDVPTVPATGPWVSPMRNAAPGQLQQTSQTAAGVGAEEMRLGNTIGDRVQETMDDASTKAAENQFLQAALPTLGQYKTTEGVNATNLYDPAAQAIAKARQDARATLTNPIQQRMYDTVTNQHLLTFGQQMADHEAVQRVEYGKQQAKSRADSLNAMSTLDVAGRNRDDSDFAKLGAQSDAEVVNFAGLSGIAPDSPQADQMLRENRTSRYRSVITSLLDQHAYNEAQDFFTDHKSEMDVRSAELLGNAVKTASQAEQVTEFRNQAVQSLQKTPGAGPLSPPIPAGTITTTNGVDGIDIHAAAGTSVKAPASGTVTKVWSDEQQGLSAQIALPGGYTATFSGLSAVNYKPGQKITEGQVLALSGKDDSGNAVTHYAMTDPDGKYVDPRQAASSPFDPHNFSDPNDEEKAVSWINANVSDPVQRREAESQTRSLANMNRQIDNQEHATALKTATDYWFQNGQTLAGLPTQTKMQLTPEDMNSFSEKGKQEYLLNQSVLGEREVGLLANWAANPQQLTVDAVRQAYAQGQLSNNSYLTSLRQAEAIALDPGKVDPNKAHQVSVDHDQLMDIFSLNQLPNLAEPKTTADKVQRVQLETAIKNEIDLQQQRANRPLTWDEKGKIARDMTIDKVYTPGAFTTGNPIPVTLVPPDKLQNATVWVGSQKVRLMDIPPQYAQQATDDLRTNGVTPTQANIAAWWLKKGSPTQ